MQNKRRICVIVGTRPNFIKVTRFKEVAATYDGLELEIVHTGQHYDEKMASIFFDQFGLRPDHFLHVGQGEPFAQIAETIDKLGTYFRSTKPDIVVVVGDVNSTLAAAIAANKCGVAVAHLESGLRSHDREMPEEHNRKVADILADIHFITEDSGLENLRSEKISEAGLTFVGNTMIDTLVAFSSQIQESTIVKDIKADQDDFALVTIHRPSNVDSREGLLLVLDVLRELSKRVKIVFTAHPRTTKRMEEFGIADDFAAIDGLTILPPLSYFDFQKLVADCRLVLTDSGGIQEETTFLRKPCLTLRPNTERPSTLTVGTNTLLPFETARIMTSVEAVLSGNYKNGEIPHLWDGKATERVMERLVQFLEIGQ
ncbi:UDP-N-acetylglucosamine 2-epimerase (non-hydrolyzing) [Cryomorphaceae bacterium 1068]|nr:UDP-N-acetylglucosamine 2-epimerase (non-hydrolyzing) [Cryomorphaceae bacterium 1068]